MRLRTIQIVLMMSLAVDLLGQRPDASREMLFPPMPVGARRELELTLRDLPPGGQYRVAEPPDLPFTVTGNSQDLVVRNGDIRLRVTFAPTLDGNFEDEVLLERQPRTGSMKEDLIRVKLYAAAFWIERNEDVDFGTINVADSTRRFVFFRTGPPDDFEWEYTRAPSAPFRSTTLQGPVRRGRDTLAFLFGFHPTSVGRYTDTVGIVRKLRGGQRLDTAWIFLRGAARARPFTLMADLGAATFNARIGDTLTLDVRLVASGPIDVPEQIESISFDLSYNPTLLIALREAGQTLSVRDGRQVLTLRREAFAGGSLTVDRSGVLAATVRFVVALGDADASPLELRNASYRTSAGSVKGLSNVDAVVNITNVWRYQDGRSRLVNPLQGVLVLDVDPNPVTTSSTMRVRNLPSKGANLVIVDASGVVAANLTSQLASGMRDFTVAASGSADVVLPRGTYYARLAVESELGGTLLSVVRLFIVQ